LRQREHLAELGACALKTGELDELMHEACRLVATGLDVGFCKVLEYLPAENRLLVRAGVGWREGVVGHAKLDAGTASPAGFALRTGQPVISNHLSTEERFRTPALLLEHGIERAMNVIMRGEADVFGVLEADSRHGLGFFAEDLSFMQAAANLLGIAIERSRREQKLRDALSARDLLLREADHRIKNSLQLVASLLGMQRSRLSDPEAAAAVDEAIARVRSVAQAHRAFEQSSDLRRVAFGQILRDICEHVGEFAAQISLECHAEGDLELDSERAIPLGLLVSELLTNAVRHAYPDGREGVVRVTAAERDGTLSIQISDDGTGSTLDPAQDEPPSLGIAIVRALCRQIGAALAVDSKPGQGTTVTVRLPRQAEGTIS
jgi:two-component sensor histidine kinase